MDRARAVGSARTVLLAVSEPRALRFARAFANEGFAVMLAFERAQILDFARVSDVVIADDSVDPIGDVLQQAGSPHDTIRMFITESHRSAPPDVHAVLPRDVASEELLFRAQSLLALRGDRTAHSLSWGPLSLDLARREARWRGMPCSLTQTQFDVLVALVKADGAVISKVDLQKAIWPDEPPDAGERLVAHIRRIRTRLEVDPSHPRFLLTSRGIGFFLAKPDDLWDTDWDGDRMSDRRTTHLRSVRGDTA